MAIFGARNRKTRNSDPIFNRHLTSDGLVTGSHNANVDGSVTPVDYIMECMPGEIIRIARLLVLITDTGSFDSGGYGNGPVLTNGITLWVQYAGGVKVDFLNGDTIKKNVDWDGFCYDVDPSSYGSGDEALAVRWSMDKFNNGLGMTLLSGDKVGIRINDNMTNLVEQKFLIQGVQLGKTDPGWIVTVPEI